MFRIGIRFSESGKLFSLNIFQNSFKYYLSTNNVIDTSELFSVLGERFLSSYLGAIQIIRDTFLALFWPPPPTVISFRKFDARGCFRVIFNHSDPKLVWYLMIGRQLWFTLKKIITLNQGLGKPYFCPGQVSLNLFWLKIGMDPQCKYTHIADLIFLTTLNQGLGKPYFCTGQVSFNLFWLKIDLEP